MPNPNNGIFTFTYELKQLQHAMIKVCDITGKIVFTSEIDHLNNFKRIDLLNVENGIYFIQLTGDNQSLLWTDKIIISK